MQIDDEKRVCGRNKQLSDNSEETATAIPVSTLEKLRDSTKIKSTLSNSRLQQVLGHIDGAKNREKALMLKLDTDPDFASFMDEVMITIGYVKQVNEIPDAVLFHGAPSWIVWFHANLVHALEGMVYNKQKTNFWARKNLKTLSFENKINAADGHNHT